YGSQPRSRPGGLSSYRRSAVADGFLNCPLCNSPDLFVIRWPDARCLACGGRYQLVGPVETSAMLEAAARADKLQEDGDWQGALTWHRDPRRDRAAAGEGAGRGRGGGGALIATGDPREQTAKTPAQHERHADRQNPNLNKWRCESLGRLKI